jgi:hypothetical protein
VRDWWFTVPEISERQWGEPGPGWVLMGDGEIVPPEEAERRATNRTPAQERILRGFERAADEIEAQQRQSS